jgi:Fusaric acid resistance protein-like
MKYDKLRRVVRKRPVLAIRSVVVVSIILLVLEGVSLLAKPHRVIILAMLSAGLVAYIGLIARRGGPILLAIGVAISSSVAILAALAVFGHPVPAALVVALVAFATSVAAGASPFGRAIGLYLTMVFSLASVLTATAELDQGVTFVDGMIWTVFGALGGIAVVVAFAEADRRAGRRDASPSRRPTDRVRLTSAIRTMWVSVCTFDIHCRDGVRRGVPLAIGMLAFQAHPSHEGLWVYISIIAIVLPTSKTPGKIAAVRVVSTIGGVLILSALALFLTLRELEFAAIVLILVSVLVKDAYPLLAGALSAAGAVLIVGAPQGEVLPWAGARLLDVLIGCAIALVCMYGLWPHDRTENDQIGVSEIEALLDAAGG